MPPTRFVTLLALTLCARSATAAGAATVAAASAPSPRAAATATPPPFRPSTGAAGPRAEELYSLRARRRFAAYMRMRLLELRSAGLTHAADVIERRLPLDDLVPVPPARAPGTD